MLPLYIYICTISYSFCPSSPPRTVYFNVLASGLPKGLSRKNLPARQETQGRSLGQEDALEKEMATHPSILAWEIPWTEEPAGLQSTGSQRSQT